MCARAVRYTTSRSVGFAFSSAATAWSVDEPSKCDSTFLKLWRSAHTTEIACSRRPRAYLSTTARTGARVVVIPARFTSYCFAMKSSSTVTSLAVRLSTSLLSSPWTCDLSASAYTPSSVSASSVGSLLPRVDAVSCISSITRSIEPSAESICATSGSDSIT